MKSAGVAVEQRVAANLRAIWPALPMPVVNTLPEQAANVSTAATKSFVTSTREDGLGFRLEHRPYALLYVHIFFRTRNEHGVHESGRMQTAVAHIDGWQLHQAFRRGYLEVPRFRIPTLLKFASCRSRFASAQSMSRACVPPGNSPANSPRPIYFRVRKIAGGTPRRSECVLPRSAAGWVVRPTSEEFYDAIRETRPSNRQLSIIRMWAQEAGPREMLTAWVQRAYSWHTPGGYAAPGMGLRAAVN